MSTSPQFIQPKDLITGSTRVSSLPEIFMMINEVVNDPTSSFSDISRVVNLDPALSARLLKIVNSSFYSFPSNIDTVTHAISVIGTEQLHDLALATTILSTFKGIPDTIVNMNLFWRHSMGVAIIARNLAIHCRETNPERFFLAGILHDIGRLIILENLPEESKEIVSRQTEVGGIMWQIEREVLGFDHADVGAALAHAWKLPLSLEEIIGNHHNPARSKRYPLETTIIHLADIIAKAMELGTSGDIHVSPLDEKSWEQLKLPIGIFSALWNQVETQFNESIDVVLSG
ncbi:MAG: HDOD domain-containing protein [Nitrospinae bacterium]|nr:HDOD domain-containing protein [Nitrospinota bacterium]